MARAEGVSTMRFVSCPKRKKSSTTGLLTGGSYGTVRLWTVPKAKEGLSIGSLKAKCQWAVSAFGSKGEGTSDLIILPSASIQSTTANATTHKPLVLLSGNGSSLVLLDTSRCTRKAFSTTVTPTTLASWDMYQLIARDLSKLDPNAKLPARRWIAAHKMNLVEYKCENGVVWHKLNMVLKCGWVVVVELSASLDGTNGVQSNSIALRLHIIHRTTRIECFNSFNERVTILGGMALNFSLPDIPIPSSTPIHSLKNMIWIGDVKAKRYIMPSKDKNTLGEEHGVVLSQPVSTTITSSPLEEQLRHPGDGLVLLDVSSPADQASSSHEGYGGEDYQHNKRIFARVPLINGTPLSLAMHPSGEWMVVGYGMNGRGISLHPLELVSMRKILK
eukprot:scaffold2849_cov203-Alexandrium_tamarense.AAC.9